MHPLEISGPRLEVASRCVAFFPVPAFDRMVAATAIQLLLREDWRPRTTYD